MDTHDGLRKIGRYAFWYCESLMRMNLKSTVEIEKFAFYGCENLKLVEFGDRLETIGNAAFRECTSLKHLKLPSIITIGRCAFLDCTRLIDIELSEKLETIGAGAFVGCERLQHIAVPLKRDLFEFSDFFQKYRQFDGCEQLTTVNLVGGTHKTVASLHVDSWRTEMIAEINRINHVLPGKSVKRQTGAIRQWMESVIDKFEHYKSEHCRYVKEGTSLLELALWKAKLGEKEEYAAEEGRRKKAKVDAASARVQKRITSGADVVVKNVLPFLKLN